MSMQEGIATDPVATAKIIKVPVTKGGKGSFLELDCNRVPDAVWNEIILQGAKVVLNRGMTKVTKETYPNAEELKVAAMAQAEKNLTAIYEGKIRIMGAKTDKVSGAVMTEARRLARQVVKDEMKKLGMKVSYVAASEITKAANALIAADQSFIAKAQANLEASAAMAFAEAAALGGIVKAIPVDEKKKAAVEAKKAEAKAQLSAMQAGKPQKRKPQETGINQ